jgi:hypothetical protein
MSTIPSVGVSQFTISGINFDVADEFSWAPSILANTELSGMTGALQGIGQEPKAGYIETTVRNTAGLPVSFFAGINGQPVAAVFRDGTMVIAANAVWVGDDLAVNQKDATVKVKYVAKILLQA